MVRCGTLNVVTDITVASLRLRNLSFSDLRLYLFGAAFVIGNVVLPSFLHQFGMAGQVFLPLYFFSLVGGLAFGWRCGLLTGIMSPLVSFWLSGMPPVAILPFVVLKSALLGTIGGVAVTIRPARFPLLAAFVAIVAAQLVGTAALFLKFHNLKQSTLDLAVGYPGLLFQLIAAPLFVSRFARHEDETPSGDSQKH